MIKLWLALFLTGVAWGVPVFQFTPVADMPTAHSVRVYWTSTTTVTATLKYGKTTGYGTTTDMGSGAAPIGSATGRLWVWSISALEPSTTYHYSVCLNDGSEICSNDATFTTLAQETTTPTLPTPVDITMPTQTGTIYTVASDCSNLVSLYNSATWGDIIEVPPGANCKGTNYIFTGKTHNPGDGWIIIRPTTWASLPTDGTRITPADEANMFKLTHIGPVIGDWRSGDTLNGITCVDGNPPGGMFIDWSHGGATDWPLMQCQPSATTKAITAITRLTSNTARLSITNHGALVNETLWMSGITSTNGTLATWLNGGGKVTVVTDANTITVERFNDDGNAAVGDTYTGSGVVAMNYYLPVTHTSGSGVPVGTCSDGAWYYDTTAATNADTRITAMYYCGVDLAWHNFNNQKQYDPLVDLRTAKYVRIIGAIFTHLPPMTDPLLNRGGAHHQHVNRYTGMEAFVVESYQTSHVILDRCWFKGHDMARVNLAHNMHGANVAFINSRISEWSWWVGMADPSKTVDTEAGGIYPQTGPGPGLIHNSYLEVGGITVHFDDSYAHNAPAANNYTLTNNEFYRPPKWFYGHALSNGRMYYHRHLLEWKVGNTIRVAGNIFDGNWRTLNRGEAIIMGFRSGGWYGRCYYTAGVADCFKPHFLTVGDLVTLDDTSIRTVATTSDSSHFTLSGTAPTNDWHYVNKLNHDTSIHDITIELNLFCNLPNVFGVFGAQDNLNMKGMMNTRVLFRNNLAYNIDQMRAAPWYLVYAGEGSMVLAYTGAEDVTINHNTFSCVNGGTCREPFVGGTQVKDALTAKGVGYYVYNNLAYVDWAPFIQDGNTGVTGLDLQYPFGYTFNHNVFFRAGGNPGGIRSGPTGNIWHNTSTQGTVPWDSDYRLTGLYRAADTCVSVPGDCTNDGTDSGVDITALLAALASPETPAPPPALIRPLIKGRITTKGRK